MNKLIAYPEYPEKIIRDYLYTVTVTQGEKTISIPVYNECSQVNNFTRLKGGDRSRRFCEFAFSGDPVRVDITVNDDIENYCVVPSRREYKNEVNGNTISVYIPTPDNFVFRINNDDQTTLAIFADEPETNIPSPDDENVVYIGAGWHDFDDGRYTVPAGKTLYLAPGAVLNALVVVDGPNTTIKGRGMIRYPFLDRVGRNNNYLLMMIGEDCQNTVIEDIKMCDTRGFNLVFWNSSNAYIKGLKILSNQISTDGISMWGECTGIKLDHCFIHCTDNIFVYGSGNVEGFEVKNSLVGADYAVFFPQGDTNDGKFKNIDIFRVSGILKSNESWGVDRIQTGTVIEDVYCVDTVRDPYFFWLWRHQSGEKSFLFKNVAFRGDGSHQFFAKVQDGNDYSLTFDNVFMNGKPLTDFEGMNHYNGGERNTFTFTDRHDASVMGKLTSDIFEHKYTALKTFIGDYRVRTAAAPFEKDGTVYVSIAPLLKQLGFEVSYSNKTLSFADNYLRVSVSANNPCATVNGEEVELSFPLLSIDGVPMVSYNFFEECVGTKATFEEETKTVRIKNINRHNNLLKNAGIEDGITSDWSTFFFAPIYASTDAYEGKYSLALGHKPNGYQNQDGGVTQPITDIINQYGTGKYHLECMAKVTDDSPPTHLRFGTTIGNWNLDEANYKNIEVTMNIWQKINFDFTVENLEDFQSHHVFIAPKRGVATTILTDNWVLTKVSD